MLTTGRPETLGGTLGDARHAGHGRSCRPLQVAGGPGVLLVLESDDGATTARCGRSARPTWSSRRSCRCCRRRCRCCPTCGCRAATTGPSSARAAGGDWYDAVPLGAGRVALVVGDAVGHGVPAAGAMSRLRGAMRSDGAARPVARGRCWRRSTPSPRRWTTSRARRCSTACSTPEPAPSPTAPPVTRRRWWCTPTGGRRSSPARRGPPLGQPARTRPTRDLRARPRAGRDPRAVLQRRHRRRRRRCPTRRWTRLADVSRVGPAGARRARGRRLGRAGVRRGRGRPAAAGLAGRRRRPGGPPPRDRRWSRCSWTSSPRPPRCPGVRRRLGELAGRARHGRAGPGRRDGGRRRGLRERRRARLPGEPSRARCRSRPPSTSTACSP